MWYNRGMSDTAFDSRVIANKFIKLHFEDSRRLIPSELVEMVYTAHGWHLAMTDKPLIKDEVRCGKDSVFIKKIRRYFDFSRVSTFILNSRGEVFKDETKKYNFTDNFINSLYEYYSKQPHDFIRRTLLMKGSPILNYKAYNDVITDDETKAFYKDKLDQVTMGQEVLDWYNKNVLYLDLLEHDIIKLR